MRDRQRARRYFMISAIELVSSLFIILFPYSAVSLVLIGQTDQSPWSEIAMAPVLGNEGGAVLIHLPIEAERYRAGLDVVRNDAAVAASPMRPPSIPVDVRMAQAAGAVEVSPTAPVSAAPAMVTARRVATVDDVTSIEPLEPVVSRSGNPIIVLAGKP